MRVPGSRRRWWRKCAVSSRRAFSRASCRAPYASPKRPRTVRRSPSTIALAVVRRHTANWRRSCSSVLRRQRARRRPPRGDVAAPRRWRYNRVIVAADLRRADRGIAHRRPAAKGVRSMIESVVESIRVSLVTNQRVVILKELEGERYLPIWIGHFEAEAIAMELQGVEAARPLPYDIMKTIVGDLGGKVRR